MFDYLMNLLAGLCCGAMHRMMEELKELRRGVACLKRENNAICR